MGRIPLGTEEYYYVGTGLQVRQKSNPNHTERKCFVWRKGPFSLIMDWNAINFPKEIQKSRAKK